MECKIYVKSHEQSRKMARQGHGQFSLFSYLHWWMAARLFLVCPDLSVAFLAISIPSSISSLWGSIERPRA